MKTRKLNIIAVSLFLLLVFSELNAQVITGLILDEKKEPVPYATIFVHEAKSGTISNTKGEFKIQLNRGVYNLTIRSLGYVEDNRTVNLNTDSIYIPVVLKKRDFEIKEVKIFPGNEDPAYFIIRKAIAKAHYYRDKIKHYEADLYIKSNFSFTNIPKIYQNQVEIEGKKLKHYFKENVTYVIESQNRITFDYPDKYDQKVISKKSSLTGFKEPPVMGLMTSSFYDERPGDVISPLSSVALRHYKYRYEGFITVGNHDVFKIRVTPKRSSDELVEGYIYIVDKLWCIYNVDLRSSFEFFDYRIKQQYENLGNGNWMPVSHSIDGKISILGLKGMFYYGASVKYDVIEENYQEENGVAESGKKDSVNVKKESVKVVKLKNEMNALTAKEELIDRDVRKVARLNRKILKEQYKDSVIVAPDYNSYKIEDKKDSLRNDILWDTVRAIPLTPLEIESYARADSINALDSMVTDTVTGAKKKKEELLASKLFFGSFDMCKDSLVKLKYDGILSVENFDFNTVDGYKYRQKMNLKITTDSARFITFIPQIGYAFNRKAVYGSMLVKFKNTFWYGNYFGIAAGKESRDFKSSEPGIAPALNAISSWFFGENYMKLYETAFLKIDFSQRINKNLTFYAGAQYDNFKRLENSVSYFLSDKKEYSPNIPKGFSKYSPELQNQKSFSYVANLKFYKRQRKPWLVKSPYLFVFDSYMFDVTFRQGVKDVFSSVADFSTIDFTYRQNANISPTAGLLWRVNAGYFFNNNQMHFSQFKHFRTSEIYVPFKTFTHTFQMLNDYEFSSNQSYVNVGGEFRSEYLLLRYISFINKKTWSESIHFNYLSTCTLQNYWEAGYSLNNLFFVGNIGVFAGFKGADFESISVKVSVSVFD